MQRAQVVRSLRWVASIGAVAALSACDTGDGRELAQPVFPLPATTTTSTSLPIEPTLPVELPQLDMVAPWPDGDPIPERYTCDGDDVTPALVWSNVPIDTIELAITVTDLDADGFVHWIMYAVDPERTTLAEGETPDEALVWTNSYGNARWDGPCPPDGEEHRYQVTVHALSQQLEAAPDAPPEEIVSILNLIALDQRSISGTYARPG